jgi:hypothetical protein
MLHGRAAKQLYDIDNIFYHLSPKSMNLPAVVVYQSASFSPSLDTHMLFQNRDKHCRAREYITETSLRMSPIRSW